MTMMGFTSRRSFAHFSILIVLLGLGVERVLAEDLCDLLYDKLSSGQESDLGVNEEIKRHIFYAHLPKAGMRAGKFSKIKGAEHWEQCMSLCCDENNCDVMLFTGGVCFHIACADHPADACQPVPNSSPRHNSTVMIVIRDVSEYERALPSSPSPQTTTSSSPASSSSSTAASVVGEGDSHKLVGESCAYGLLECVKGAQCVLNTGSKSRYGHCSCQEGYRDTGDGHCVQDPVASSSENVQTDSGGEKEKPGETRETTLPPVTRLTVSAGTDKIIQLPENYITLTAFVLPKADEGETYSYEWSPVKIPDNAETASMDGKNTETLKLSNLIAGIYVLKVKVTGENKFGEALINVTVLPAARLNKPPDVIIKPSTQEVYLPNSAILDGSESKDDDGIVSYKWEEVSGPLQNHQLNQDNPMLTLKDLAPGNYTFRLTVTDTDGVSNSTYANVTIKKEKDYPPKADAGSDVVIFLPQTSLTLYGNSSSDDKGKLTYEWIKTADDKLTAGMTGVRSPCLELSNLEVGDYIFTLKVTDSAGQTDTADVHVFVKPETNHPPVAKTAGEVEVYLPVDSLKLDGSNSTADGTKMEYQWTQLSGPTSLTLNSADQAVALATGNLAEGKYEFKLIITDGQRQESTDTLHITVKKYVNLPPKAKAGGNTVVQVPVSLVVLDGSKSSDDHGITKYLWQRDSKSLAAGTVVNNSDHQAVLQLVNLVEGQYMFTLTVEDAQGLSSSDTATIQVNKNAHHKDFVEMILDADISHFTVAKKESVRDQLELLLQRSSEDRDTAVEFVSISEDLSTGHLCLWFQVVRRDEQSSTVMSGVHALRTLKSKASSGKILDYSIVRLDLAVCQNNCSGHGHCDQKTKQCVCEAFWMPNFFTSFLFSTESNCDWSILYVVIICFIILVAIISAIWAIICCVTAKRCKLKLKGRRRHRYSLLRDLDNDSDKEKLEMTTKGKIQNSSVMISESDFSSDEETLFVSSKKASNGMNGRVANGSKPSYKNKLKT